MDTGSLPRQRNRHVKRTLEGDSLKKKSSKESISFLKQYASEATIHGISHVFREGESFCHRATWMLLLLLCGSCATYLSINSYLSKVNNPIALSITDTQYPLDKVWFPAVVLCPSNKMLIDQANEFLYDHIKDREHRLNMSSAMTDFYKALVLLQHPLFAQMASFLNSCDYFLPYVSNINITALMLYSLPKCEDLLTTCYWKGNQASCCKELFRLQMSEEGFCYAFNSLTSEGNNEKCKYFDAHNELYIKERCELETITSYGPATGLQVYFRLSDNEKYQSIDFTGGPKVKVQVYHPNDFPEPGIFHLMPHGGFNRLNFEVSPTVTTSKERIKTLSVRERGCVFKEEISEAKLTRSYSQSSCMMECRMAYLLRKCFCLPYYMSRVKNETVPVCDSMQLHCLVNASIDLRFHKPPIGLKSVPQSDSNPPLSCEQCWPTCQEVRYDIAVWPSVDFHGDGNNQYDGSIDVHYKNPGAVTYTRDVTYDFITVIASIGGIGGLFLGGSILSVAEIFYWLTKAALNFFLHNKLEHKTLNSQRPFTLRH